MKGAKERCSGRKNSSLQDDKFFGHRKRREAEAGGLLQGGRSRAKLRDHDPTGGNQQKEQVRNCAPVLFVFFLLLRSNYCHSLQQPADTSGVGLRQTE